MPPQPSHIHPSADPNELAKRAIEKEIKDRVNAEFRTSLKKWFMRYAYFKDQKGVVTTYPNTKLYDVQRKIFEHHDACLAAKKPCKQIILKPRRGGASTGVQAAMYFRGRLFSGREAAIMGDIAGTSSTVFEIYRRLAENDKLDWGDGLGNLRADDKENNLTDDIKLPNGSTYKKVTAGSTNANRSGGIQFANCTEVAYYPINLDRDPLTSFLGSWYGEGEVSYAAMDSTSNGPAGKFYEYYADERNDWHKIFSAWHEEPTHRLSFNNTEEETKLKRIIESDRELKEMQLRFSLDWEQMNWINFRLYDKCGGNKEQLNKEFPNTVEEAFLKTSALRFNIRVLESMENMAKNHPPERGDFVTQVDQSASFIPSPTGEVAIYEDPRVGCRYLGSFDPCAGEDQQQKGQQANPDAHSVRILRDGYINPVTSEMFPPKTVAHYHSRADVTIAVEQAAAMSRHYGKCLFVVETNGVGLYPVKALRQMGIPLWQRQQKAQTQGQTEAADGWFSNAQLRATIIDNLGSYLEKWKLEAPTLDEFDMATIAELKKFVTANGKDQAMAGFHDDCLVPGTLVRCRRGMVPIEQVTTDDLVLTHMGRFRKVTRLIKRHSESVFEIKATGRPTIRLTGNHPILVCRQTRSWSNYRTTGAFLGHNSPEWLSIESGEDLTQFAALTAVDRSEHDIEYVDMLEFAPKKFRDEGGTLAAFTYGGKRRNPKCNPLPRYIPVDDDFCFLMGYFCAEGSAGVHTLGFASHSRERPIRDHITRYLKTLGLKPRAIKTSENGWGVYFGSVVLCSFFKTFGKHKNKRLPVWVETLPLEKQRKVIIGYLLGDGCFSGGKLQASSISPTLAFQIHSMIMRNAIPCCIRPVKGQNGHADQHVITMSRTLTNKIWGWLSDDLKSAKLPPGPTPVRDQTSIRFVDGLLAGKIEYVRKIEYEGPTYCLDVEEDHSFHANGVIVHNCVLSLAMVLYLRQSATLMTEPKRKAPDIKKILARQGWKLAGVPSISG